MFRQGRAFTCAFAIATAAVAVGCGDRSGLDTARNEPQASADSAERQVISLTGCVQRRAPGSPEFALAHVATAGLVGTSGEMTDDDARAAQGQAGSDPDAARPRDDGHATMDNAADAAAEAAVSGASTYRLIRAGKDDLGEFENKRVTVIGRLAADVSAAGRSDVPQTGQPAGSSQTSAEVVGSAPPMRGLYVESVRKVSDSCNLE